MSAMSISGDDDVFCSGSVWVDDAGDEILRSMMENCENDDERADLDNNLVSITCRTVEAKDLRDCFGRPHDATCDAELKRHSAPSDGSPTPPLQPGSQEEDEESLQEAAAAVDALGEEGGEEEEKVIDEEVDPDEEGEAPKPSTASSKSLEDPPPGIS